VPKRRRRKGQDNPAPRRIGEAGPDVQNDAGGTERFPRQKPSTRPKHQIGNHHIVPSSRGGPNTYWNSFSWSSAKERSRKHPAWHDLFVNALPSEAALKIQEWMSPTGKIDRSRLSARQRDAWDEFFGQETTGWEAIEWIDANFLLAEEKWERINAHKQKKNPLQ
jgi:hypothetical protein